MSRYQEKLSQLSPEDQKYHLETVKERDSLAKWKDKYTFRSEGDDLELVGWWWSHEDGSKSGELFDTYEECEDCAFIYETKLRRVL